MGTGSFPGGKMQPGRDADPSPPSSADVKNRVELLVYLYSPKGLRDLWQGENYLPKQLLRPCDTLLKR